MYEELISRINSVTQEMERAVDASECLDLCIEKLPDNFMDTFTKEQQQVIIDKTEYLAELARILF